LCYTKEVPNITYSKGAVKMRNQIIEFVQNNQGKLGSASITSHSFTFFVSIGKLNVQEITTKQILISDGEDDPEYLTRAAISLCGINSVELSGSKSDIVIKYDNANEVIISYFDKVDYDL